MKIALLLFAALVSAHAQTAIKAAVEIGGKDEVKLGTLTVNEKELNFEGAELMFQLPVDAVEDVQVAGFREKWMSVGIRPSSEFAKSYAFLLQADRTGGKNSPARLQFLLPPNADLKAGLAIARSFKDRVDAVIVARQTQEQAAKAQAEREKQERQVTEAAAKPSTISPAVPREEPRQAKPSKPKIRFAIEAYYLSKKPGGFVKSYGLAGELVFREDGIGFTFTDASKLDPERQRAADGGAIWIPASMASGTIHTQKALLGASPTMFWVGLTPKRGTPAYERLRPLLTEAGEVLFTIRHTGAQARVGDLLTKYNTNNFGGME